VGYKNVCGGGILQFGGNNLCVQQRLARRAISASAELPAIYRERRYKLSTYFVQTRSNTRRNPPQQPVRIGECSTANKCTANSRTRLSWHSTTPAPTSSRGCRCPCRCRRRGMRAVSNSCFRYYTGRLQRQQGNGVSHTTPGTPYTKDSSSPGAAVTPIVTQPLPCRRRGG